MVKAPAAMPLAAMKRRRETRTDMDLFFDAAGFRENCFRGRFISVEPMPARRGVND
jgi:hypothetical protein